MIERGAFDQIRTVEVDGQALRVAVRNGAAGSAPPLLIFNGIGANLELLEPFVAALDARDVVAFDVPGVGGSPAPLLPYRFRSIAHLADRLLRELGYDGPTDALGVSWGGGLAQQFAYLLPERCRRLILAATSTGMVMVPGRLSVMTKLANPRRYYDADYLKRIAPALYGGLLSRDPALIERHVAHIQPPQGLGYLYQLAAISGWTSLPWLHRIGQPTLIMAGTEDPIVPLLNARLLAWLIPRSELVTVDDGHLFLTTSAGAVAPTVSRFLAGAADDPPIC
jgi:poly(3-hydroxyalkanoate) depolymerase